jgi:ectoine hydroxylase-related dioxygenase (phytanoyl-CoA dioxygenase family)
VTRREQIERDGFIVVRNLLSPEEIQNLKDALHRHFANHWVWESLGKYQPNAAVKIPSISWLFSHPEILSVFRELYGGSDIVFTGNCDAHLNMLNSWHKDGRDGPGGCFLPESFADPDCRLFRAGVYLQDHLHEVGGLTVRKGSHLSRSMEEGQIEHLATRAGDVIFFDMRLTHRGKAPDLFESPLLSGCRKLKLPRLGYHVKETYWKIARKPPKLSIFFTYGDASKYTKEFCEFDFRAKCRTGDPDDRSLPVKLSADLEKARVRVYTELLASTRAPATLS